MTAHLPGPWWVKSWQAYRKSFQITVATDTPFVFTSVANGHDTMEATCRLVTAAPELLDALLRLVEWHTKYHGEGPCSLCLPAYAAIAKATGGQL